MPVVLSYDLYQYRELFRVTEYREGTVYKTETTGKYVKSDTTVPEGFVAVSPSTDLLRMRAVYIELFDFEKQED